MIPANSIAWNLTGDREMQLTYSAYRAVASAVRQMTAAPLSTQSTIPSRKRGRPKIYTEDLLKEVHAAYKRHCQSVGDIVTVKGLAAFTAISKRTWERYLSSHHSSP